MNAFQRLLETEESLFGIAARHVDMVEEYAANFVYKEGMSFSVAKVQIF